MQFRFKFRSVLALLLVGGGVLLHAQDSQPKQRGRKYKAPADTSHIEVTVLKDTNSKPLLNAAVIFHPVKDGVDEGNLEVKTNEQGKAVIDVIPTGSNVAIQVIADGFSTYAGDYLVNETDRSIEIRLLKPRAQVSTYTDNSGKPSQMPAGVQEPATKSTLPGTGQPLPPRPSPTPPPPPVPPPAQ